ncbi:MAG: hypothetical protein AAGA64_12940 [Bacteroidota bacterium]
MKNKQEVVVVGFVYFLVTALKDKKQKWGFFLWKKPHFMKQSFRLAHAKLQLSPLCPQA